MNFSGIYVSFSKDAQYIQLFLFSFNAEAKTKLQIVLPILVSVMHCIVRHLSNPHPPQKKKPHHDILLIDTDKCHFTIIKHLSILPSIVY